MKLIKLDLNPRTQAADANVIAFIEANNLDPKDILAGEVVTISDETLTVNVIQRREDGLKVLTPNGERVATKQVAVPLISAPENHGL